MSSWTRWTARVTAAICAVALISASLSGCAPIDQGIDADAAARMQISVSAVTQAAAAGDPAVAIAALDELETQLKQNMATGAISADRSARIQASIDLVRVDLTAALPVPKPAPSHTPTEQTPDQKENNGEDTGKDDKKDDNKDDKKNDNKDDNKDETKDDNKDDNKDDKKVKGD